MARSEVRELAFLCATLATRVNAGDMAACTDATQSKHMKVEKFQHGELYQSDPWAQGRRACAKGDEEVKGKDEGNRNIQYIAIEKVGEVPAVRLCTCETSTCIDEDDGIQVHDKHDTVSASKNVDANIDHSCGEKGNERIAFVKKSAHVAVQALPSEVARVEFLADSMAISKETERTRPEASFRDEWAKKTEEHQTRYPGGTLPTELRSFEEYFERRLRYLDSEQIQLLQCQLCGKPA